MSVFMPVPHCFAYCSFVVHFETKSVKPFFFFFSKIILATGSLEILMNFMMGSFISEKENAVGIWIVISLNV